MGNRILVALVVVGSILKVNAAFGEFIGAPYEFQMTAVDSIRMECAWTDSIEFEEFFKVLQSDSTTVVDSVGPGGGVPTTPDTLYDTVATGLSENTKYIWLVAAYSDTSLDTTYSNKDTCYTLCGLPHGMDTLWVTNDSVSLFCARFTNDTADSSDYFFSLYQGENLVDSANSSDSAHVFNNLLAVTTYKAYVYYINGDSVRTDSMYAPAGYDSVLFTTTADPIPFFPKSAFILFAVLICLVTVAYLKKRKVIA